MFIHNTLARYAAIIPFLLLTERIFFALLLWKFRITMKTLETLVARVGLNFGIWMQFHLGLFEHTEVVSSPRTEIGADDAKGSRIVLLMLRQLGYDKLRFKRMTLLFARVVAFLSFFGRSMGDSEASMRMTSYSVSLSCRALRPGRAKRLSLMRVSSTHLQILYALLSLMP